MVREMIGGCCVCLDERGWNENPLVYCDGIGCDVAVHQACYGIVKVPSGPWFCCKCSSQEQCARLKCELCPRTDGAFKKTDTGGWAHVVCALYIPEVRFGNVSTMEPIVFSSVPHDRFLKTCYICDENGKESARGACMNCNKASCKLSFHVTCAQSKRQLCEEASANGHVQYVGYCSSHWTKRFKQPVTSLALVNENDIKKNPKERKRSRNNSTSSTNSVDCSKSKKKIKNLNQEAQQLNTTYDFLSPTAKTINVDDTESKYSVDTSAIANSNGNKTDIKDNIHSFFINGLLCDNKEKTSPLNTPVDESHDIDVVLNNTKYFHSEQTALSQLKSIVKTEVKKRKSIGIDKAHRKIKIAEREKDSNNTKKYKSANSEKKDKCVEIKKTFLRPSQRELVENGKVGSWKSVTPKVKEVPDNFQEFLEHQWNESANFLLSKAEHFDVASLLNCLHQLKADNLKLEKKLLQLQSRRDRLLGVNARLSASITSSSNIEQKSTPLSAMLSKLNNCAYNIDSTLIQPNRDQKRKKLVEDKNNNEPVSSPDLAMLAAASADFESKTCSSRESPTSKFNIMNGNNVPFDEKPSKTLPQLVQPNVHLPSVVSTTMNGSLFGGGFLSLSSINCEHQREGESKK